MAQSLYLPASNMIPNTPETYAGARAQKRTDKIAGVINTFLATSYLFKKSNVPLKCHRTILLRATHDFDVVNIYQIGPKNLYLRRSPFPNKEMTIMDQGRHAPDKYTCPPQRTKEICDFYACTRFPCLVSTPNDGNHLTIVHGPIRREQSRYAYTH